MPSASPASAADGLSPGRWLGALPSWPATLCAWLEQQASPVVRVVIAAVRGSAPREPGACLLVSPRESAGTIGGGHLEWRALAAARDLLAAPDTEPAVRVQPFVLGAELAQCCGGAVEVWLERFTPADLPLLRAALLRLKSGVPVLIRTDLTAGRVTRRLQPVEVGERMRFTSGESLELLERLDPQAPLWLYGAGHVGQALVRILVDLPFEITWVDSRAGLLPGDLPHQVRAICAADPVATVREAPVRTRFLVMTHDHALDYALCRAILQRDMPCAGLGLIGSRSKAARFRSRLARDGLEPGTIARLTCPIGMPSIPSKLPAAIAVGIAAMLLTDLPTAATEPADLAGADPARALLAECEPGCSVCRPAAGRRS